MPQTTALLIWGVLLVFFIVVEATSVQLVSIWFAAGALAGLLTAACGVDAFWIQALVAIGVSALTLIATRPLVKKFRAKAKEKLNADRTVGRHGIVTEEINNDANTGMIRVGSTLWTARSSEEEVVLPVDARVTVEKIEGVKAIVRKSRSKE